MYINVLNRHEECCRSPEWIVQATTLKAWSQYLHCQSWFENRLKIHSILIWKTWQQWQLKGSLWPHQKKKKKKFTTVRQLPSSSKWWSKYKHGGQPRKSSSTGDGAAPRSLTTSCFSLCWKTSKRLVTPVWSCSSCQHWTTTTVTFHYLNHI